MKKIFNKRNSILLPLTALVALSGFAVANLNDYDEYVATAEEVATPFWISDKAQAYFMKQYDGCLRFDLSMSVAQYNELKAENSDEWAENVEVGMLLVPEKVNDGLTLENTANRYIQNVTLEQSKWIADNEENPTTYTAWVAVGGYEFNEWRYTLDITAVGYLQTGTAEYTDSVTHSMTEVTYNQEYVAEAFDGTIVTPEWLVQYYANSINTVTFNANNGSEATQQTLLKGKQAREPTAPVVDGWTFDGWYNGEQKYDFSAQVTTNITLNAKYTQTVNANTFEVYSGIDGTAPIANTLMVALKNASAMSADADATLNGETITDYAWENNQFTVDGTVFGAKVYGNAEMVVTDGTYTATVKVPVVTKYMANYNDLNNMPYYGGIDTTTTEKAYDGYFVMTDNIDYGNNSINRPSSMLNTWDNSYASSSNLDLIGSCGFAGVFDGQGYAILNVASVPGQYGLFGNAQKDSVVKNLGMLGTVSDYYTKVNAGMLGNNFAGTLKNCYFDITVKNSTTTGSIRTIALAWSLACAQLTDVVVKYDVSNTVNTDKCGLSFSNRPYPWKNGIEAYYGKATNLSLFSQEKGQYANVYGDNAFGSIKKYGYNESATATMTDNTYWNMEYDQPIFKTVMPAVKTIAYNQATPFEVYSGINGKTPIANAFTLDLTAYNLPANPNSITIVGDRASMTVDNSCWSNGVLTVADLGAKVYGDVSVEIATDDVIYKVKSLKVVTKYLASYNDLKNIFYYGGIDETAATKPYDGYFVLKNNLDGTGTYFNHADAFKNVSDDNCYAGTGGFAGVFDGNGYKIYNTLALSNAHGGIFGCVAKTAVIKNVKIVSNVKITNDPYAGGNILGKGVAGTIENVSFDVTVTSDTTKATVCFLARFMAYARMKDVVVKVNSLSSTVTTVALCEGIGKFTYVWDTSKKVFENPMSLENVHVFCTTGIKVQPYTGYWGWENSNYATTGTVLRALEATLLAGMKTYGYDESATVTMTYSTYWDLSGSQPVWKEKVA